MMKSIVVAVAFAAITVAHADESVPQQTDYAEVAAAVNETMRTYHYDPAALHTPDYKRIEAAITELAEVATSDEAFIEGFREVWKNGPFSHVEFRAAGSQGTRLTAPLISFAKVAFARE